MSVEGCWSFDFFGRVRTFELINLMKKAKYATGGFDPGTVRMQNENSATVLTRHIQTKCNEIDYRTWMYQKTIYFAANGNFGIKLGFFFSFFSKIPRGIWKISFYMMFYKGILSKNHCEGLLNFFSIGNPSLNCVQMSGPNIGICISSHTNWF